MLYIVNHFTLIILKTIFEIKNKKTVLALLSEGELKSMSSIQNYSGGIKGGQFYILINYNNLRTSKNKDESDSQTTYQRHLVFLLLFSV